MWQHDFSTGHRRIAATANSNDNTSRGAEWRNVPALRKYLCGGYQVLWTMRNSHRDLDARVAPAQTRRSVLPQLRRQLSGRHKILRPLRETNSPLSECQLSFNLCA